MLKFLVGSSSLAKLRSYQGGRKNCRYDLDSETHPDPRDERKKSRNQLYRNLPEVHAWARVLVRSRKRGNKTKAHGTGVISGVGASPHVGVGYLVVGGCHR
jgi:hypothetical protein